MNTIPKASVSTGDSLDASRAMMMMSVDICGGLFISLIIPILDKGLRKGADRGKVKTAGSNSSHFQT